MKSYAVQRIRNRQKSLPVPCAPGGFLSFGECGDQPIPPETPPIRRGKVAQQPLWSRSGTAVASLCSRSRASKPCVPRAQAPSSGSDCRALAPEGKHLRPGIFTPHAISPAGRSTPAHIPWRPERRPRCRSWWHGSGQKHGSSPAASRPWRGPHRPGGRPWPAWH